jgi:hypothetical protein
MTRHPVNQYKRRVPDAVALEREHYAVAVETLHRASVPRIGTVERSPVSGNSHGITVSQSAGGGGINPQSPALQRAQKACQPGASR